MDRLQAALTARHRADAQIVTLPADLATQLRPVARACNMSLDALVERFCRLAMLAAGTPPDERAHPLVTMEAP